MEEGMIQKAQERKETSATMFMGFLLDFRCHRVDIYIDLPYQIEDVQKIKCLLSKKVGSFNDFRSRFNQYLWHSVAPNPIQLVSALKQYGHPWAKNAGMSEIVP